MNTTVAADFIVNLCGTFGLVLALLIFRARDPKGGLTRRFVFALGLVTLVFLLRGFYWLGGAGWLGRLSVGLAAFIPLAALLVVEGMLRQHAPRIAKLSIATGSIIIAALALLVPKAAGPGLYLTLALFQVIAFFFCGLLLFLHPRSSLSTAERQGISRLCMAAFFLLPFMITDFRSLIPYLPVRLGGLGALLLVIFALLIDRAGERRGGHAGVIGLQIGGSLLLALGLVWSLPELSPGDRVRLAAVTLSGVLVIGLANDVARAWLTAGQPGLLDSVAVSKARTRDDLFEELLRQPLFHHAIRLGETDIADYDPALLQSDLQRHVVLRQADSPWQGMVEDAVAERLAALMAAHGVSHLIVADTHPLDLIGVRIPLVAADRATETALLMAGRLLAAAPRTHAGAA